VYTLVKSGELRHRRVGLQIRIPVAAIDSFLAGA
jgi:excisionase family DNA binding protein